MPDDQYECDMCGATFDTEEELQEHNQEEHGDQM
jgi:rubredoxin